MPDLSIDQIAVTSRNARVLRGINEFGMNLADFAALTTNSRFDAFGNGTGYTVQNWINDGVFANLAAVQAVYPIVQAATDKVDWVLLQTGWDFMIYGALGNGIRGQMKRELLVPAGHYITTGHKLEIGYGRYGTPPGALNGNGYVQLSVRGEGSQYDPSGNGMTGTTIVTDDTAYFGINCNRALDVKIEGLTVKGPYDNYLESNSTNLYKALDGWNIDTYRRTSPAVANANWLGGAAVNIGIGQSLYTDAASAAAYPPRVLPSYFGGGTTQAAPDTLTGGSGLYLQDVNIRGFVIGLGRPYGDTNDEYLRFHGGTIQNCVKAVVTRHSQNRNMSFRDCRIESCHTAFSNKGGLAADGGNAQMHGSYDNIHFGRIRQIFDHDNGGWTGPITLRNCYAESVMSIGRLEGRALILDGTQISFIEQENNVGVAPYHFKGTKLILTNGSLIGIMRHGLMLGGHTFSDPTQVVVDKGSVMDTHIIRNSPSGSTFNGDANLAQIRQGFEYMRHIFALPGRGVQIYNDRDVSEYGPNLVNTNRTDEIIDTHLHQEWTQFYPQHPNVNNDLPGSQEMQGTVKRFPVPKITRWQQSVTVSSRSGLDITCPRIQNGAIKADVGDVFMFDPGTPDATRGATWFICRAISGSNMILRQLNNFFSTNGTDYQSNGWQQINSGWTGNADWICTRIKQNHRYWVGDVTNGSAVITNVKHGFRFGATDDFTTGTLGMQVGDIFLHQEDERANTGGSGLSVQNVVTAVDYTANTITLTNNFNITRTNYPIVFFVDVHNA